MIAQANSPAQRERFLAACRGKRILDATLPLALELFGQSLPGRFYAGEDLALDLGGRTAWAAGRADPDELGGFLAFSGCKAVMLEPNCPAPTGWQRENAYPIFGLTPGAALPLPDADEALWASLAFDRTPSPGAVADVLFSDRSPARRDDFYSELCTKLVRDKARVWTLERDGQIVCTVGAYALHNGQAYMACGETAEALRGYGIGGRLIVQMANDLAAEGWQPLFLCSPERVHFYTRLGFIRLGEMEKYTC